MEVSVSNKRREREERKCVGGRRPMLIPRQTPPAQDGRAAMRAQLAPFVFKTLRTCRLFQEDAQGSEARGEVLRELGRGRGPRHLSRAMIRDAEGQYLLMSCSQWSRFSSTSFGRTSRLPRRSFANRTLAGTKCQ